MEKIVFLHGLAGRKFDYSYLLKYFKKKGHVGYDYEYKKKWGNISITELAKEFKKYCDKIKGSFVIVAESMGGLVASYYLEFLGGSKKCKRIVTICTPFKGTKYVYLFKRIGALEMRPNSVFLKN